MLIANRDHPDVAAAVRAWEAAGLALNTHVLDCQTCTRWPPIRYNRCLAGHRLALERFARAVDVQNADAAVSGPGRAEPPRPPRSWPVTE